MIDLSNVRVIGGKYRGRRLRAAEGLAVRPTSDRLRETLFNILAPQIDGASFLDICAGSGAVGIEALSRGAGETTFIERSRRACAAIEANLSSLGIVGEAQVINGFAVTALKQLDKESRLYDVVFIDPPYASDVAGQVMNQLGASNLLSQGAVVILEHRAKTAPAIEYGRLRRVRQVRQGESALTFYEADDD